MVEPRQRNPGYNATCIVCQVRQAKYLCKCENAALCQDGSCISSHLAKSTNPHMLADYEIAVRVSGKQAQNCFQAFDTAVEVSQFIDSEVAWLNQEKEKIIQEIDRYVATLCAKIREIGNMKKAEAVQMTQKLSEKLMAWKEPNQQEAVLAAKAGKKHLLRMRCLFSEPSYTDVIRLSSGEKVYQLATGSGTGWSCDGAIDAISIRLDGAINLTAIGLAKQKTEAASNLETLEIVLGTSTKGEVLYSHNQRVSLASDLPTAVVRLARPVALRANTYYTIRTKLNGGRVLNWNSAAQNQEQNGLKITLSNSIMGAGDSDNGSSPREGIFFAFYYEE